MKELPSNSTNVAKSSLIKKSKDAFEFSTPGPLENLIPGSRTSLLPKPLRGLLEQPLPLEENDHNILLAVSLAKEQLRGLRQIAVDLGFELLPDIHPISIDSDERFLQYFINTLRREHPFFA